MPIQTKMVKESMLTREEKAWIKARFSPTHTLFCKEHILIIAFVLQDHNRRCYDKLAPFLKDDSRAMKWLKREAERGIGVVDGPGGLHIDWD